VKQEKISFMGNFGFDRGGGRRRGLRSVGGRIFHMEMERRREDRGSGVLLVVVVGGGWRVRFATRPTSSCMGSERRFARRGEVAL
jgi:hypothetical protein